MAHPFEFRTCLEQMARLRGSCLYLEADHSPTVRVAGEHRPLDIVAPTPEDLHQLAARLIEPRDLARTGGGDEMRFARMEPGAGRVHVTVRRRSETPSFELRPVFGRARDTWGGISDAEYRVWKAHTYIDALAVEVDVDAPPFSRVLGKAIALGSTVRQMDRPDLVRAAEALAARMRAHANRRSIWDDAKRRNTVDAARQFRTLLERGAADDAAFADRVLAMCKVDIEVAEPAGPVKPRTPVWREAERRWNALVRDFGRPQHFSSLSPAERTRAIAEHRAVWAQVSRDGFGGGSVRFVLMEADQDPSGDAHAEFGVVFPAPCRLDASVVRELNKNAWERANEVPHL